MKDQDLDQDEGLEMEELESKKKQHFGLRCKKCFQLLCRDQVCTMSVEIPILKASMHFFFAVDLLGLTGLQLCQWEAAG